MSANRRFRHNTKSRTPPKTDQHVEIHAMRPAASRREVYLYPYDTLERRVDWPISASVQQTWFQPCLHP
ncbi:hypothetical protein BVI1335_1030006 [Burkholderia vietnamiensis]|nr:hypothetical protein BVI1335_1030006 [Burkholderia vietnamiensis]